MTHMKNLKYFVHLVTLSVGCILVFSCASGPTTQEIEAERAQVAKARTELEKIAVTGSRIKRANTERTQSESLSTQQTVQKLVDLVEQNNLLLNIQQETKKQVHIGAQFHHHASLSAQEKQQLYTMISRYPEAAGQLFKRYKVNPTVNAQYNPVSTFAMDVDTGSFNLAKTMLNNSNLPNPVGIRIEEFVNAFDYQYAQNEQLFSLSAEAMPSPFREGYHVLHIGAQTQQLSNAQRSPSNIVLVVDVSGSMADDSKLSLLKHAMKTLISQLKLDDNVAIVQYNNQAKTILKPTTASKKRKIFSIIDDLKTGGGTNAEAGLILGYELAKKMQQPGFNNRVILTSDGMANTGAQSPEALLASISSAKENGIFLNTLGVGVHIYNDHLLEQLANQGNGIYSYIGNETDIQNVFVDNVNAQLQTVAKDAKIQIKFNPKIVSHYRLLGYENRHLEQQDFLDAKKDGAEIGAGQKVTALYEIKLQQHKGSDFLATDNQIIGSVAVAYKKPQGNKVFYYNKDMPTNVIRDSISKASPDTILSVAVAAFAEKLRMSYWARFYKYTDINTLIYALPTHYQNMPQQIELLDLINKARNLDYRQDVFEKSHPISSVNFERVPLLD